MESDALKATDPQGSESPFVLEASELPLDRSPLAVARLPALRLSRYQRVQSVGPDPRRSRRALSGRAAPLGRPALAVGTRKGPDTV